MGLERINRVKAALDLHFDCPVITVAGTNGKGSVCALIAAVCRALADDVRYQRCRKAVIDFLYTRQGHVEKTA